MRFIKKNPKLLRAVAIWTIVLRILDVFWIIEPSFRQRGLEIYWTDIAVPIGLGGIWIAVFIRNLKSRPLLVPNDPRNTYARVGGHGH